MSNSIFILPFSMSAHLLRLCQEILSGQRFVMGPFTASHSFDIRVYAAGSYVSRRQLGFRHVFLWKQTLTGFSDEKSRADVAFLILHVKHQTWACQASAKNLDTLASEAYLQEMLSTTRKVMNIGLQALRARSAWSNTAVQTWRQSTMPLGEILYSGRFKNLSSFLEEPHIVLGSQFDLRHAFYVSLEEHMKPSRLQYPRCHVKLRGKYAILGRHSLQGNISKPFS